MKKRNKTEERKLLKVPIQISIHLLYLYQDKGLWGKELLKRYPQYSKATIYRHATKPVQVSLQAKALQRRGRPSKLTDRKKRNILREINTLRATIESFATKRLHETAGVQTGLSEETVRRFLHSQGYRYYQSRKKGLLTPEDLKRRLKYTTEISKRPDSKELWFNGISFCIDEAGFQHKYNPFDEAKSIKTLAWRKRDEGLERNCANLVQEIWANLVQEIKTVCLRWKLELQLIRTCWIQLIWSFVLQMNMKDQLWVNLVKKNRNCLFKIKFGTQICWIW